MGYTMESRTFLLPLLWIAMTTAGAMLPVANGQADPVGGRVCAAAIRAVAPIRRVVVTVRPFRLREAGIGVPLPVRHFGRPRLLCWRER
jgi:hypothetical protein